MNLIDDPKSDLFIFQKNSIYFNCHLLKYPAVHVLNRTWTDPSLGKQKKKAC